MPVFFNIKKLKNDLYLDYNYWIYNNNLALSTVSLVTNHTAGWSLKTRKAVHTPKLYLLKMIQLWINITSFLNRQYLFFFQTVQLRITVAEHIMDGKTPSLGHVIVGANTSGTELSHWNQMISSPRKPIAMWHYLRK